MRPLAICTLAALAACAQPAATSVGHLASPSGCDGRWSTPPLTVAVDETAAEFQPATARAVAMWNAALGYDVLVIAPEGERPDVLVVKFPELVPVVYSAYTATMCWGGRTFSGIVMRDSAGRNSHNLVAHELGHALGLSHNEDEGSVMHPIVSWTARITARDAEAVGLAPRR